VFCVILLLYMRANGLSLFDVGYWIGYTLTDHDDDKAEELISFPI
jgi:hypothetical protein